ncbi:MAG TPA: redoxin domain-containing protein [Isosphaeraceae bacterium]|nr:redoxin domain-containing protein [Isosphaeraceae bacterium]
MPRWRRVLRASLVASVLAALAVPVIGWLREPPRIEPPFERIVGEGAGPVKELGLKDLQGRTHTAADWAGRPAVVLFVLAPDCPGSRQAAPEMARLARDFAPRGIVFFGVCPAPRETAEAVAARASEWALPFPILLDPAQQVIRQAGVRVTPEAVVLLPDGQVLYRGRVDDRSASEGPRRPAPRPRRSDLEAALVAILAEEMPVVTQTRAFGTPLPASTRGDLDETITFNKHVAPILYRNCARCHRPGEVGPFPLLTYRDALKRADFIREVTAAGQMPPWKAHPGAGVFLDAPRLSAWEKDILARWAETGCEQGDPADLPPPPRFADGWALGQPDLVLTMPEPYVVPATGWDTYRAFALPLPTDRDLTITGVEFRPGNRRVVHHSRVHVDETGDARRRERADPIPGFSGFYGDRLVELPYPGLGAWTPGLTPRFAPEGTGRVLRRGSEVVLNIHYHPTGKSEADQSSVGLYFARKPLTRKMAGYTLCTTKIDIPPGEKRYTVILASRVKADVHLHTVVPHAHHLCREFRLAATLPDGTCQPLLWIHDWNLDWQDQYRFAKPVRLPEGTLLTLAAYFDNSEDNPRNPNKPPRRVRYGVTSDEEMCACHLELLPDDPSGYAAYPNKSPFGL